MYGVALALVASLSSPEPAELPPDAIETDCRVIEMGTDQEAQAAIEALAGRQVGGRSLTVNEAKPREDRGGGGGRGGYGSGGGRGGYGGGGGRGGYGGGRY